MVPICSPWFLRTPLATILKNSVTHHPISLIQRVEDDFKKKSLAVLYHYTLSSMLPSVVITTIAVSVVPMAVRWIVITMPENKGES